jgi:hypothetical protein
MVLGFGEGMVWGVGEGKVVQIPDVGGSSFVHLVYEESQFL